MEESAIREEIPIASITVVITLFHQMNKYFIVYFCIASLVVFHHIFICVVNWPSLPDLWCEELMMHSQVM